MADRLPNRLIRQERDATSVSPSTPPNLQDLAKRAQVFDRNILSDLPQDLSKVLASADADKRILNQNELTAVCRWAGTDAEPLWILQGLMHPLVDQAKAELLRQHPELTLPGGELHPEHRAEACWRDCFHFLRVSIYGTALDQDDITHSEGMKALVELYELVNVPLPALLDALEHLRRISTDVMSGLASGRQATRLGGILGSICEKIRNEMKTDEASCQSARKPRKILSSETDCTDVSPAS